MRYFDVGRGYIYVAKNSFLPNIFKVGMTKNLPEDRIKSLNAHTTTLGEFSLSFSAKSLDAARVEKIIHSRLDYCRVQNNREFFSDDLNSIIEIINSEIINDDLSMVENIIGRVVHFEDLKMLKVSDFKKEILCVSFEHKPLFYTVTHSRIEQLLKAEEKLKELQELAKKDKRSLTKFIENILEDYVDNHKAEQRKNQKRIRVNLEDL